MKKYAVFTAVGSASGKRRLFTSKKEANAFYNQEVKKLATKTGFVHVKNAQTHCVIKGKFRDPRKKIQNIKPECNW